MKNMTQQTHYKRTIGLQDNKSMQASQLTYQALVMPILENDQYAHLRCFETLYKNQMTALLDCLIRHQKVFNHESVAEDLIRRLFNGLNDICLPTLCLEINVARINRSLMGSTQKQRFESFVGAFKLAGHRDQFFQEYPVLFKLINQCTNQWQQNCEQFINRLVKDHNIIQSVFNTSPGKLLHMGKTNGDSHKNGQQVMTCHFESGFHLVYKPRSMELDEKFQQAIQSLNQSIKFEAFKPITVINQGTYGWAEYVTFKPCSNVKEARRYHLRLGHHLALLNVLQASDFHHENVIIHGEFPVLIDLETLSQLDPNHIKGRTQTAWHIDQVRLLNTGFLPQKINLNNQQKIDVSALGASEQKATCQRVKLLHAKTDNMQLSYQEGFIKLNDAQVKLSHSKIPCNSCDYLTEILTGFEQFNQWLIQHKSWFIDLMISEVLSDHELRSVFRPTATYTQLLKTSFHPDYLRSFHRRDQFLLQALTHPNDPQFINKLTLSEQHDIKNGDVPIFHYRITATSVFDSEGNEIKGFLNTPPAMALHRNIQSLSPQQLQKDRWTIIASFTAQTLDDKQPEHEWLSTHAHRIKHFDESNLELWMNRMLHHLAFKNNTNTNWLEIVFKNNNWYLDFVI